MILRELSVREMGLNDDHYTELARLGIQTIEDLLTYFPFRYDDFRLTDLSAVQSDDRVTVQGEVTNSPSVRWYGKKKSRLSVKIQTMERSISIFWFNQAYLKGKLQIGQQIAVSGKWNPKRNEVIVDRSFLTEKEQREQLGRFEPVYSVTRSIKMKWLRELIYQAFIKYGGQIEEILPQIYIEQYKLLSRAKAMYFLHFPKAREQQHQARRRMAYEELFLYECKLMWRKQQQKKNTPGLSHSFELEKVESFITGLPFSLTTAQRRVITEVLQDLQSPELMNRLLQGDVGSGKTVVAAAVLYANFLSGYQGALMVPTEILADQHAISLRELLIPLGMRVAVLTGSMKAKEKRETLEKIAAFDVDLVVGTHALIQEPVTFHKLGLIITDEQHRFGVKQRAALREKGLHPDVLCMTATPIPRTLAISVYGDMDVSTIDELPAGRKSIQTYWTKKDLWSRVITFIQKECSKGSQAYVICPLIEESEKIDLQNAVEVYEQLTTELAPIRVGLLHGKMHPLEKEEVMKLFAQNIVQVLVSTTVVEVGVNVPNATLMVIYDADRFGLAQLHQLRGRVGRGDQMSTCVLMANPKSEIGVERMRVMAESTDGFEIAKQDLALRGPGDFLGIKQSGLPDFKVADLNSDMTILEIARTDAIAWVNDEQLKSLPEAANLLAYLDEAARIDHLD